MLCAKNSGIDQLKRWSRDKWETVSRGEASPLCVLALKLLKKLLESYVGYSRYKKRILERDQHTFFHRCFIANGFGQCWYAENVSFCLNNRERYVIKVTDKLPCNCNCSGRHTPAMSCSFMFCENWSKNTTGELERVYHANRYQLNFFRKRPS